MQQANEALAQTMKEHGAASVVIDTDLAGSIISGSSSSSSSNSSNSKLIEEVTECSATATAVATATGSDATVTTASARSAAAKDDRVIELQFALGEFEDTPLAIAEEAAEEEEEDDEEEGDDEDREEQNVKEPVKGR